MNPPGFSVTLARIPDGHAGIMRTVGLMRALVEEWKVDAQVMNTAAQLIARAPQFDTRAELEAVFRFVRDRIRYVMDPVGVESVATPIATMRRGIGDCDDQCVLLGALLESVGHPVRFVIGDFDGTGFSHVWLQAFDRDAMQWVDMDPIKPGAPLGWRAPGLLSEWTEPV
jgi:transglutaminase-like putative cysteine protease